MSKASCESPNKLLTTYESKIKESGNSVAHASGSGWCSELDNGKERRPPMKMPDEEMSGNVDNQSQGVIFNVNV